MEAFPRFPIEIGQSSLNVPILDCQKQWLPNLTMSVKPNHDFNGGGEEQYPIAKRRQWAHDGSNR
jgi:hypothetical protein